MSYIGSNYTQQLTTPAVDYFNGNGVTTTFQLSRAVTSVFAIQVVVNNVPQNAREAYGITSSNQIVFTSAPSAGSNNIYVIYDSQIGQFVTPSPGTVTASTLAPGAVVKANLDVTNLNGTGAMQLPAGTTAQRPGNISGYFRHNTERKTIEFNDGTGWQVIRSLVNTTGGVVVETPSYRLHALLGSGTFFTDTNITADVLVVGGGGAGGQSYGDQDTGKGGGGAGGVVYRTGLSISAGSYTILVGAGGPGMHRGYNGNMGTGANGDLSSAFGVQANGGGGGGCSDNYAGPSAGGSGGGGGARNSTDSNNNGAASNQGSFAGWISLGNAGGRSGGNGNFGGGGGGGANGAGGTGQANNNNSIGGTGGSGINLSSIFSTSFGEGGWFAGGGGGGSYSTSALLAQGPGGQGGGGNGVSAKEFTTGHQWNIYKIHGQPNTGGGGGGSSEDQGLINWRGSASGSGGSGIVLVKVYL